MVKQQTIKFHAFKEGKDMLTKIANWYLDRTLKGRLTAIAIITAIMILTIFTVDNKWIVFLLGVALALEIVFLLIVAMANVIAVIVNRTTEAEEKRVLAMLKTELSYEDFTEVIFEPYNWESKNIQRCLKIFEDFQITHFEKIGSDDSIIVIAKDANGKSSTPVEMEAIRFNRSYKTK